MKKNYSSYGLFYLIAILFVCFGTNLSVFSSDINADNGLLSSNAQSDELASPDTVYISFSVITRDKDSKKASLLNTVDTSKVLDGIRPLLGKNETLKTASYSLNPYYEYNNSLKRNEQIGFEVVNKINVKLKNTDKIGDVINTSILRGADSVDNLEFTVEDTTQICNRLLIEATQKARSKADTLARALNVSIGGIKNVSSSCNSQGISRPMYSKLAIMDSASSLPTPIEQGDIKIEANVNIDFIIKN